jgi:hypothetical protein
VYAAAAVGELLADAAFLRSCCTWILAASTSKVSSCACLFAGLLGAPPWPWLATCPCMALKVLYSGLLPAAPACSSGDVVRTDKLGKPAPSIAVLSLLQLHSCSSPSPSC